MGAGHLVAGFTQPAASPVLAVGSTVIDLSPTPVKEWAVGRFGTADKPILIGSVLLVTLGVTAAIGLVARTHLWRAATLLGGLVLLAGVAAGARPIASVIDVVPALVALVVGAVVLVVLVRLTRSDSGAGTWSAVTGEPHPQRRQTIQRPVRQTIELASGQAPGRRAFLGASAGVAALAVLAAVSGQIRSGARAVRDLVLPRPTDPAAAFPAGLETTVPVITPLRTTNERFYRVDTNLVVAVKLAPDQLAGPHTTLAGTELDVQGSGEMFAVGKEKAKVLCGNVPTANATVYIVDSVLLP